MTIPAPISIVGGVYRERCLRPAWDEIYGSAGRAASAMSAMGSGSVLHSYLSPTYREVLTNRAVHEGFKIGEGRQGPDVEFDYDHGLSTPKIFGARIQQPPLQVSSARILRFGLIEGDAVVHGDQVVYDPQNAEVPAAFEANGSTAKHLALILNHYEAAELSGLRNASPNDMARALLQAAKASIVVIKRGPFGALVYDGSIFEEVPAYQTKSVWKIGSGDNFSAHFALRWMYEGKSAAESADLASRATAYYCENRGFAGPEILASYVPKPIKPPRITFKARRPIVYLAAPFFSLGQLWIVTQARRDLRNMGLDVFSPYHDVGLGSAEDVVKLDLEAIGKCDMMFAIGDGLDSGTIYEIGYARALGKPVIFYCENESAESKKMMEGSGCRLQSDYVSAIYEALWAACEP